MICFYFSLTGCPCLFAFLGFGSRRLMIGLGDWWILKQPLSSHVVGVRIVILSACHIKVDEFGVQSGEGWSPPGFLRPAEEHDLEMNFAVCELFVN